MADLASLSDLSISDSSDEVGSPPCTKHLAAKRQEIESKHAAFTETLSRIENKVHWNTGILANLRKSQAGYDELSEGPGPFTEAACNQAVAKKYVRKLESQGRKSEKRFKRIVKDWVERECYWASFLPSEERAMQFIEQYRLLWPRMQQLDFMILEKLDEERNKDESELSSTAEEESEAESALGQVEG